MSIERFKIVNDDGSTNKSEYERCIQFLNDYIEGKVKVYHSDHRHNLGQKTQKRKNSKPSYLALLVPPVLMFIAFIVLTIIINAIGY